LSVTCRFVKLTDDTYTIQENHDDAQNDRTFYRDCLSLKTHRRSFPMSPPSDISESDRAILARIACFTMTSVERQIALIDATRYVVRRRIPGSLVECGVWRGGSVMAALLTLIDEGVMDRDVYLYDTFSGMTPPVDVDKTFDGTLARTHLERDVSRTGYWCVAHLDEVRRNVLSTGYPEHQIHFVKGPVEETLPTCSPTDAVALLRLDTDWYESTKHELTHLFPKVSQGGVVIVDDYGHWQGAKLAVDEFLQQSSDVYYLHRIDYTGRLLIKS